MEGNVSDDWTLNKSYKKKSVEEKNHTKTATNENKEKQK